MLDTCSNSLIVIRKQLIDMNKVENKTNQNKSFICPCGKGYSSYAAVYTHIKCKHNMNRVMLENITKPSYKKAPKGRPKLIMPNFLTLDIEKLTILEIGVYKLSDLVQKANQPQLTLTNDDQVDFIQAQAIARSNYIYPTEESFLESHDTFELGIESLEDTLSTFFKQFCKHLTTQYSAKVLASLLFMSKMLKEQDSVQFEAKVWGGISGAHKMLQKVFYDWSIISKTNPEHSEN